LLALLLLFRKNSIKPLQGKHFNLCGGKEYSAAIAGRGTETNASEA
jgi:hypothetical protein